MSVPPVQIQVTPLMDVLLVLLVMGLLSWVASPPPAPGLGHAPPSPDTPQALQGQTLPVRPGSALHAPAQLGEQSPVMGVGLHGQLHWQGLPVTRDILERQLREILARNPRAEVMLALDEAVTYADLLPWLEWLQSQHVTQLTLLSRALPTAQGAGKP